MRRVEIETCRRRRRSVDATPRRYLANTLPKPIIDVSRNNFRLGPRQSDLPEQLRPYQVGRVEGDAPPEKGIWPAGAIVWNRGGATPPGWLCAEGGTPGTWANLSLAVGGS